MDLGSLFLILALGLLVALFIARPFFARQSRPDTNAPAQPARPHDVSALLAERDRVVRAVHELDFDHTQGKISAEDYPVQRAELLESGAAVLKALAAAGYDVLPAGASPAAPNGAPRSEIAPSTAPVYRLPNDELEEMILTHRRARQEKTTGFCPKCGKPFIQSDVFCSRCGTEIHAPESQP